MQRAGPSPLDLSSTRSGRSASISSDRPSLSGTSILSPPVSVNPEPLYIAASAASQLVSSELDADGASVSSGALSLVNAFLDQILYSILSRARSTQLNALRPAVIEVLKARLGKEAVVGADEELKEYLGDGENEELESFHGGQEPKGDFDLELAWKLARLRCMVYTRLGDMEEDDEDEYIEKESLDDGARAARRYSHPSSVTPAAAIFLTSVLEYIGEQALYYAGQATQRRIVTSKHDQGDFTALPGIPEKPMVEEVDVFSVGRDSPLSRLWRTWRSNVRSPRGSLSRALSRESLIRRAYPSSRNGSISIAPDSNGQPHPSVEGVLRQADEAEPARVPLPMSERDIDEIEVPGLAPPIGDEDDADESVDASEFQAARPKSMFIIPPAFTPPSPNSPEAQSTSVDQTSQRRPSVHHTRTRSLPTPVQSPFASPSQGSYDESQFVTPMETADPMEEDAESLKTPTQETVPTMNQSSAVDGASGVQAQDYAMESSRKTGAVAAAVAAAAVTSGYAGSQLKAGSDKEAPKSGGESVLADFLDVDDEEDETHASRMDHSAAVSGNQQQLPSRASSTSNQVTPQPAPADPEDLALSSDDSLRTNGSKKRDAGFVLAAAPSARKQAPNPSIYDPSQSTKTIPTNLPPPTASTKYSDAGATRLTPLQETAEHGRDMPNDSPTSSSVDSQPIPRSLPRDSTPRQNGHSKTPSTSSTYSVNTTKPLPQNLKSNPAHTSTPSTKPAERNAAYGIPASTSAPAVNGARSQAYDNINGRRGSASSQNRPPPVRKISSEGKKSLEDLLRGDETVHYTLTPKNMEDMESPNTRWRKKTGTADLADFLKNTSPPGDNAPRPITSSAVSTKSAGLRSNPPEIKSQLPSETSRTRSGSKSIEIQSDSPGKNRPRTGQPRDATVQKDTTRDLADFAKSTGPDHPAQLPAGLVTRPGKTSVDATPRQSTTSPRSPTQQGNRQSSSARRNGPKLEAREAVVQRGESSELIDFIREGPPRDPRDGTHRIPRTVAPFRTTMDSDELTALGSPKQQELNGRTSHASSQASSFAPQSSVNSRTALIDNAPPKVSPKQGPGMQSAPANRSYGTPDDDEDPMKSKRKQRRVRDPYAIDSDSDEDLEETAPTPKAESRRGEESLMDFLRNTAPPPESKFQPQPLMVSDAQKTKAAKSLKQSASSPTLKDRMARSASTNGFNGSPPLPSGSSSPRINQSAQSTQNGSRQDTYNPPQRTNTAARGSSQVAKDGTGPRKAAGVGGTADLADFLRNSGPPEPPVRRARSPSPVQQKQTGLSRFFSRRRRVAV